MTGKMTPGMTLAVDDKLVSANGKFTLWMQSDGNLVLYHNVSSSPVPYWASDTEWGPIDQHPKSLTFQADAQMVLKDDSGILRWSSGTWGPFEDPFMVLQDDGNLVIYDKYAQPIWASGVGGGLWAIPGHGAVSSPRSLPVQPTSARQSPVSSTCRVSHIRSPNSGAGW